MILIPTCVPLFSVESIESCPSIGEKLHVTIAVPAGESNDDGGVLPVDPFDGVPFVGHYAIRLKSV
jgi:hypothetical protein